MSRRAAAYQVTDGDPAELVDRWQDTESWPQFMDGCARVVELSPDWPAVGSWVVWRTRPGGRGSVREEVVAREPLRFTTKVVDSSVVGTQTISAGTLEKDGRTRLEMDLDYELAEASIFQSLMDSLFIRRALRDSLKRSLARFAAR